MYFITLLSLTVPDFARPNDYCPETKVKKRHVLRNVIRWGRRADTFAFLGPPGVAIDEASFAFTSVAVK